MSQKFWTSLKQKRLKAGYGLVRFAIAAGIAPSELCHLEHGRCELQLDETKFAVIADLLGAKVGSPERRALENLAYSN